MERKAVAYFRVSTARQGISGLGLEGQRTSVESYCAQNGYTLVRSFEEIESGKNDARPRLAEALAFARRSKAVLIVAKLDRLARSVAFVDGVMRTGVEFVAVDIPSANRLVLHILAAVAEQEALAVSQRTKSALQAAKARGTALGTHNPAVPHLTLAASRNGASLGSQSGHSRAIAEYADLLPRIVELRDEGKSLRDIASALNAAGHKTRRDAEWTATQVHRVLQRAGIMAKAEHVTMDGQGFVWDVAAFDASAPDDKPRRVAGLGLSMA